jgi:Raf kinase inhibitor-like YbhB/YbcL family protein
MKITTQAFENGAAIPRRYAKKGGNVSPALEFGEVPETARSIVLIVDDPDAPHGLFTHWVLFNLGPAMRRLPEGAVPAGARQGKNSWGEPRYGGPQPPDREHRYFFRLYALDTMLGLADGASRDEVERAMKGHVLAQGEWMGRYAPDTVVSEKS